MSFLSKISTGRRGRAQKVVIYAPEGFGKSTLASKFPSPLFLDVEDSTSQLEVSRLSRSEIPTLSAFESALSEIAKGCPCRTLVVDTIDWAEQMATDQIIADANNPKIKGVEDFGYGKGWTYLKERVALLLAKLDLVNAAGINVLLLAHAKVNRFDPPEGAAPFDRYELKLSKQVAPLVKEWADMLLFGNYRLQVREAESGKTKGVGGRDRLLHTERCAAWDAKNRHGMQAEEKWDIAVIEKAFRAVGAPWGEQVSTGAKEVAKHEVAATETPSSNGVTHSAAETAGPSKGEMLSAIRDAMQPDPELARICEPHASAINSYLLSNGRIKAGESWANMPADFANRVKRNPAGFLKIVNGKGVAA